MKKILLFSITISALIFTACVDEAFIDEIVPENGNAELLDKSPVTEGVLPTEANVFADFEVELNNGTVDELVKLNLTNNSQNAVSYEWDFGNGSTSTKELPEYNYKSHGYYTITLKARGADGSVSEISKEILVLCIYGGGDHGS